MRLNSNILVKQKLIAVDSGSGADHGPTAVCLHGKDAIAPGAAHKS